MKHVIHVSLACSLVAASGFGCKHLTPEATAPTSEVAVAKPPTAPWWQGPVFYEVFVRSFADSDGDGVGDFNGLRTHLDALEALGVQALWLMPMFESPSYHGYDVTNYRAVEPEYGTMADFEALLAEAHRRGIRIIVDFVLNHSSREHPWFLDAMKSKESSFRDYYRWEDTSPEGWGRPWDGGKVWHKTDSGYYYGLFWEGMPDLNLANPKVEAEMLDAMRFWLAKGVDGFRVDAARHLFESEDGDATDRPESHALMKRYRAAIETEFPEALLVAESWTSLEEVAPYYGDGDEFQLAFGFDTASAIKSSVKDGNRADLNQVLARADAAYKDRLYEAPFISNHDMKRFMQDFGGDVDKAKLAACVLMALPGTPFLYYGEEIGMQGGPDSKDEDKRTPFRWNPTPPGYGFTNAAKPWHQAEEAAGVDLESQRKDPTSLWHVYRDAIAARHQSAALMHGTIELPKTSGGGRGTTAFVRSSGEERVLFVVNLFGEKAEPFTVETTGAAQSILSIGEGTTPVVEATGLRFDGLGARSCAYLRLTR